MSNLYRQVAEGAYFDTSDNLMQLLIILKKPTVSETAAIRKGAVELAIFTANDGLVYIVSRFGKSSFDSPYHASLQKNVDPRQLGNLLLIILADNDTGQVKVQRMIGLPEAFAAAISGYATAQIGQPITRKQYLSNIAATYAQYSTQDMFDLSDIHCRIADGEVSSTVQTTTVQEEYPGLPDDLQKHYKYVADAGKVIMSIPLLFSAEAAKNPAGYQVSLPVKYVLEKGYTVRDGYIYCDVPYNKFTGAEVPDEYFEY